MSRAVKPSREFPFDSRYDFAFRPETYWPEFASEEDVLSRIKGTARREIVRRALAGEELERLGDNQLYHDAMEFVLQDELSEEGRTRWGRVHPSMMGGEYLPPTDPAEVEIVRVELASVTGDVLEVRAQRIEGRIRYRVVDEYESDFVITPEWSDGPLAFGEIIDLIDTSAMDGEDDNPSAVGLVDGPLEGNIDAVDDPEELLGFVTVSSRFYPQLGAYYDERAVAWAEEKKRER
jgi:hypothetical protein